MKNNPDVYLLYEYSDKLAYTVRFKVVLDAPVNPEMLQEAAQEAITRFPYFSVEVGLDEGQNYILKHNEQPIAVIPEKDERLLLGSDKVNRHLFAITYRDNCVWFSISHSPCGAKGAMFWIKTTLYQYMLKRYGKIEAPADLKLPGTTIPEEELFIPDPDSLPKDEPLTRYEVGNCDLAIPRFLMYLFNPFVKDNYYYEIQIPTKAFLEYAAKIDGSPNSIAAALMYKTAAGYFKEKKDTFISGRIAADYSNDIGASQSYRDFIRFIYVKYEWSMKDESVDRLNMRARGAIISQNQPELGIERYIRAEKAHEGIDAQPDLKSKKKYASGNSTFRSDKRAVFTISYVGKIDWGEMEQHIQDVFTITDGDFMVEINALKDHFCISLQLINKDPKPAELFCSFLKQENIPYTVSRQHKRFLPRIELP